jgi:hypothetical protein
LFADFGTAGDNFGPCESGNVRRDFNTIDLDTNSSALTFYFGFSGFHFENGDGIYKNFFIQDNKPIF